MPRRNPSRPRTTRRPRSESTSTQEGAEEDTSHLRKKARISNGADTIPDAGALGQQRDLAVIIPQSKKGTLRRAPAAVRNDTSTEDIVDTVSPNLHQSHNRSPHSRASAPAQLAAAMDTTAGPMEGPPSRIADHPVQSGVSTSGDEDIPNRLANFELRLHALERWPQEATFGLLENRVQKLQDQIADYEAVMASMAREIETLRAYIRSRDEGPQGADNHAMIVGDPCQGEVPQDGEQAATTVGCMDSTQRSDRVEDIASPMTMQNEAMDATDALVDRRAEMAKSVGGSTHDDVGTDVGEAHYTQAVALDIQTDEPVNGSTSTSHTNQPDNERPAMVDFGPTTDAALPPNQP